MDYNRSIKHFIMNIFAFDWRGNFKKSENEIASSNYGLTMTGSLITVFALLVGMVYQLLIGYTKMVIPYFAGIPFLLGFMQHGFWFMKRKKGVTGSLIIVYAFGTFIFAYVCIIHDYVGRFEVSNLIPLMMCLTLYPVLITDLPWRKLIYQIFLSVYLIVAISYFFDVEDYHIFVSISNILIMSFTAYLCGCFLVYQRLKTYEALRNSQYMSTHDMATGLRNRITFFNDYNQKAEEDAVLGTVVIDVNNFKHINDTYGHIVGDEAILFVANVLKSFCNDGNNMFYRYGGDEFVGLILGNDLEKPEDIARKVQNKVKEKTLVTTEGLRIPITISVGSTLYQEDDTVEKMVARADEKMYKDKEQTKRSEMIKNA